MAQRYHIPAAALGCTLFLLLAGCGGKENTGSVSGKVTFGSKTLTEGTVTFFAAGGKIKSSLIARDGTYTVQDVPIGPAKIAVIVHTELPVGFQTPQALPPKTNVPFAAGSPVGGSGPANTRHALPIPERYASPETSGLKCQVTDGPQAFPIALQP